MAIKAITGGGWQDASGNKIVGGSLVLRLSQDANITGVGQLAPKVVTATTDSNGNIPATSIWFNDQLSPSGTVYVATLFDSSNQKVWGPENWSLTGSSPLDIGSLVPASSSISYSGAVLLAPTGNQEITNGALTVDGNLITESNLSVSGTATISGAAEVDDGLTVASGDVSGTEATAIKLFNSNSVYAKIAQDTTFGTTIRRTDSNTPTYVSVVPNGTIANGTAKAIWRVYGTDIKADATNFESIDLEAETVPVSSPGGPLPVYYLKTRIGGTGQHRALVHQVGGINVLFIDPTTGAIVTAPKSGDSVGASADYVATSCQRGDINIGINGRALRSTNNAGTNTIALISADSSDSAVISQALKLTGKVTSYNSVATAGIGLTPVTNADAQTGLGANYNSGSAKTIVSSPTAGTVWKISGVQSLTRAATTSSTFPSLTLGWTDAGGIARTATLVSTSASNATTVTTPFSQVVHVNATNVTLTSAAYATSGATSMQYSLAYAVEQLQ